MWVLNFQVLNLHSPIKQILMPKLKKADIESKFEQAVLLFSYATEVAIIYTRHIIFQHFIF